MTQATKFSPDELLPQEHVDFVRKMLDDAGVPPLPAEEEAELKREIVKGINFTPLASSRWKQRSRIRSCYRQRTRAPTERAIGTCACERHQGRRIGGKTTTCCAPPGCDLSLQLALAVFTWRYISPCFGRALSMRSPCRCSQAAPIAVASLRPPWCLMRGRMGGITMAEDGAESDDPEIKRKMFEAEASDAVLITTVTATL